MVINGGMLGFSNQKLQKALHEHLKASQFVCMLCSLYISSSFLIGKKMEWLGNSQKQEKVIAPTEDGKENEQLRI